MFDLVTTYKCIIFHTIVRRLPNETIIPLIKEQVERSSMDSPVISFQEAAAQLCKTGYGLSSSQKKALKEFMDKMSCLSKCANSKSLPDFLQYLWTNSGLEKFYRNKNKVGEPEQDDEQEDKNYTPYVPLEIGALFEIARNHFDEWRQREHQIIQHSRGPNGGYSGAVPSLVELSRKSVKQNIETIDVDNLPEWILDELVLAPYALGRSVIREFLESDAFELSEEEDPVEINNKVSIGTVHGSKGLEWRDVYVPYLNQGFLPTNYWADDEDHDNDGNDEDEDKTRPPKRHVSGCVGQDGRGCDKNCSQFFRELDDERLGGTAEERHLNEERRLAHVASTRAKDKLVFTSFQHKQSEFRGRLRQLPESVVRFVNKTGI